MKNIIKLILIVTFLIGLVAGILGIRKDKEEQQTESKDEIVQSDQKQENEDKEQRQKQEDKKKDLIKEATANIMDFDYKVKGKKVFLEQYNGSKETLYIKSSYKVKNKKRNTDLSDFMIGIGNSDVKFVIIDDGITKVKNAIFNSSDVEKVYFPKSMKIIYDNTLSYMHPDDGEKIQVYYGGSKKQWKKVFKKYERETVGEAIDKKDAGAVGTSIADKLNEMIGTGYDSDDFDFHYSVKIKDLK